MVQQPRKTQNTAIAVRIVIPAREFLSLFFLLSSLLFLTFQSRSLMLERSSLTLWSSPRSAHDASVNCSRCRTPIIIGDSAQHNDDVIYRAVTLQRQNAKRVESIPRPASERIRSCPVMTMTKPIKAYKDRIKMTGLG